MKSWRRFPILFAIGIVAFIAITDLLFVPLHERNGAEWTSRIDGIGRLFELPGIFLAESFSARFQRRPTWVIWLLALALSIPIYTIVGILLQWTWTPLRRKKAVRETNADVDRSVALSDSGSPMPTVASDPAYESSLPQPDTESGGETLFSRRGFFVLGRRAAVVGVAATASYGFLHELRNLEVTRQSVRIRNLSAPLAGLRVVQLSDVHLGPWTSLDYIRRVIATANALKPDLVMLTGDYVHQSDVYIPAVIRELTTVRASIGVIGVLGNHDWWENVDMTRRELAKTDIRMVDNGRVFISGDRTIERLVGSSDERTALCVAGVGDLWEGSPDYKRALAGLPNDMPRLLLSHNPDVAEEKALLNLAPRIDLMLSGHTHGGQVALPWLGTVVTPSKYGKRYAAGMVQGPICPVYINRGIGTTILPIRLGVRPEISLIELQPT